MAILKLLDLIANKKRPSLPQALATKYGRCIKNGINTRMTCKSVNSNTINNSSTSEELEFK